MLAGFAMIVICSELPPLAWAQDGTPAPGQGIDGCLVAVSAEKGELRVGESMHLWIWGAGVEPGSWNLEVGGDGALGLQGARVLDPGAAFVEWTVIGEREGQVTVSVSMVCELPGDGSDTLTLTVPAADDGAVEDGATLAISESCPVQLSVSETEVAVGDEFHAWFVGAQTEPRSWNLTMEGDGSVRVLGMRELDSEYVEWQLQGMEAGTVRLTGAMECKHAGDGISSSEVVITERAGRWFESSTWGTTEIIQVGLMAALLAVLAVLGYLAIRRR